MPYAYILQEFVQRLMLKIYDDYPSDATAKRRLFENRMECPKEMTFTNKMLEGIPTASTTMSMTHL